MPQPPSTGAFSRRAFIGGSGAAGLALFLAACSTGNGTGSGQGSSSGGGALKFWNMPWGNTEFNVLDKKIALAYKPGKGLPSASYQVIQWANFTGTFSTAVASNTGPAVSSGGGTQAFLYASQGKIAYADHLLDSWKTNGLYDDFLPGVVSTMKTKAGYAAIPYNLDMRVLWYNQSLFSKYDAQVPTDWDSYRTACAALKKHGIYGYGSGSGAGNFTGSHVLVSHMINNGGGLFAADEQPNCVTPENIEAMDWVLGLVKDGYVDPACASYTSANVQAQYKALKFGMGFDTGGLADNVGGTAGTDLKLASPLIGPSGKKGALYFPNNIMMYTNTPSQQGTEDFLTYYYKNMSPLWTENTGIGLPVLQSITQTKEFQANPINVKIIDEWLPISRVWGAPGSNTLFLNVTTADGTPAMTSFTQSILGGSATAKEALTTLQSALQSASKS